MSNIYLKRTECNLLKFGKDIVWLDTGTFEGLLNASNFIRTLQEKIVYKIGNIIQIYKDIQKNKFIMNSTNQNAY
jgi:glucose-1-phosphate thymidylyltransferase